MVEVFWPFRYKQLNAHVTKTFNQKLVSGDKIANLDA